MKKEKEKLQQVESEKQELEQSLEELDAQHQEVVSQMIDNREQMQTELALQHEKLEEANEASAAEAASQAKVNELQEKMNRLQNQLLALVKQIQLLEAEKIKRETETEELREKSKDAAVALNDFHMDKQELEAKLKNIERELLSTREKTERLTKENTALELKLKAFETEDEIKEKTSSEVDPGSERTALDLQSEVRILETTRDVQKTMIVNLEKQLETLIDTQEICEKHEKTIAELQKLHQDDTVAFQKTDKQLNESLVEANTEMSQLKSRLEGQQRSTENLRDKLKSAQATIEELAELKKGMDEDLIALRHQYSLIYEENESLKAKGKRQTTQLEHMACTDEQGNQAIEENRHLQVSVDNLTKQLHSLQGDYKRESEKNVACIATIKDLEMKIVSGEEEVASRDARMVQQKEEIASLQQMNSQQLVCQSKESVLTLEKKVLLLSETTSHEINTDGHSIQGDEIIPKPNGVISEHLPNGDVHISRDISAHEELAQLQKGISEKDKIISALNDTNSSMLKLLEERSIAAYGDSSLVSIHHLQTQIKSLQVEKEQILSILNEKSRENSNLKSENHKLMNVVSQQKGALSKLQEDNRELSTSQPDPTEQPNQEMTKEAIKKLSQIIRDKDMEIEALSQKNQTLLQVLQESSQEGAQMASVMLERDNLSKQILAFQNDREQIIAALNAKHQEAVAYHAEVQRLSALVSMETEKQEKIQQEYSNLVQQYEDKQQALLKTQNELVNYKQKYVEVDNRYKEILQTTKSSSLLPHATESIPPAMLATVTAEQAQTLPPPTDSNAHSREIEDLKAILQSHEIAFSEKDKTICDKENVILERDRTIMYKDKLLSEKERELGELRTRLGRSEECVRSHETECQSYKKQYENVAFQLQGVQNELSDLRQEREQLMETTSVTQQEISVVREANNKLSMSVYDKDFEINALKDKVNTLTKIVQEAGEGEKGEMDRLMKETEAVQQQVQMFKQDRDQAFLALQQQQAENQQLRNEVSHAQDNGACVILTRASSYYVYATGIIICKRSGFADSQAAGERGETDA